MRPGQPLAAALAGLTLALAADVRPGVAEAPQRIVSINLCADELLLRLVPERVASVTFLARDPTASTVADLAAGVPVNHGQPEEVMAFAPDLVVAGRFSARAPLRSLQRVGEEVLVLGVPTTFAEARALITDLAGRLGVPERGAALVARMEDDIAAATTDPAQRPRAVVLSPNGVTVGEGSLVAELIERAGLHNVAAELAVDGYGRLPLETIVMAGIEVLIVDAEPDAFPALASELLDHPALKRLGRRITLAPVPARLWTCAGPQMADAVSLMAAAAGEARARRPEADR